MVTKTDKTNFIKKHEDLFLKFKFNIPGFLGLKIANYPLEETDKKILAFARKELTYSEKTYDRDILASLYRQSREATFKQGRR